MSRVAGSVFLAASSHGDVFANLVKRALASIPTKLGKRRPRVAVSYAPVADSMAGRTFMKGYAAKVFWGAEVHAFHVAGESTKMDPGEAKRIVDEADLVFVTGGDPVLGARLLVDAGADKWLRDARLRGVDCMGISAGAIMLGAFWAEWPETHPPGAKWDGGALVRCTGVVEDLVVDCHAEDDHWAELALVSQMLDARAHPLLEGSAPLPRRLGLPTGGAIVVSANGAIEPIGAPPFEARR